MLAEQRDEVQPIGKDVELLSGEYPPLYYRSDKEYVKIRDYTLNKKHFQVTTNSIQCPIK